MKRLFSLICSGNTTFIKTKRNMFLFCGASIPFALNIFFCFSLVYYCNFPVTNCVMVTLKTMFIKIFMKNITFIFILMFIFEH